MTKVGRYLIMTSNERSRAFRRGCVAISRRLQATAMIAMTSSKRPTSSFGGAKTIFKPTPILKHGRLKWLTSRQWVAAETESAGVKTFSVKTLPNASPPMRKPISVTAPINFQPLSSASKNSRMKNTSYFRRNISIVILYQTLLAEPESHQGQSSELFHAFAPDSKPASSISSPMRNNPDPFFTHSPTF